MHVGDLLGSFLAILLVFEVPFGDVVICKSPFKYQQCICTRKFTCSVILRSFDACFHFRQNDCVFLSPCHWNQRQYGLSLPKCTTFGNSPLPLGIALDRIAVRRHGSWSQNKSSCFLLYPSPYDAANPNFFSHRWYQCRLSNSPVYMCVISENHTVLLLVLFCNLQTKYQGVEVLFIFVASVHFTSSCR